MSERPESGSASRRPPLRALVVDDEPVARRLLRSWLDREAGVETLEAADGLEGLEMLTSTAVGLVVSDVNMPRLDGVEMLAAMRGHPTCAHVPVVMISAVKAEQRIREAVSHGVWDYINKPLEYERVMPRLRAALERAARESVEVGAARLGRVLIADPDPTYLQFAKSALAGRVAVETASSPTELAAKALARFPNLVLVSDALPNAALTLLSSKARELGAGRRMRLCALTSQGKRPADAGSYPSVLRTLDPETFSDQVLRLLAGMPARARQLFPGDDKLDEALLRALRNTLGMLSGEDPRRIAAATTLCDRARLARCRLHAEAGGYIELIAGCSPQFAGELADQTGPERSGEDPLCWLVGALAAGLADYCASQCHCVEPSEPEQLPGPAICRSAGPEIRLSASWKGEPVVVVCRLFE